MSESFRRYELLIPLRFNDVNSVPEATIAETLHFRIFVDVSDSVENRKFFLQFNETLKKRFQQIDIWLTSHPIEVL
jgi:hypothetical protein